MALDMRTVILVFVISSLINVAVVFFLWRLNRKRFLGFDLLLAAYACQLGAVLLLALRSTLPEAVAVLLGNGLFISFPIVLLIGIERFMGTRGPQVQNIILLAVFLAVQAHFFFISPNLQARNINVSAASLVICAQFAWLLFYRVDARMRGIARGTGFIIVGYCIAAVFRIVMDIAVPPGSDFFTSTIYDAFVLLTYMMLSILLTFTLILMVNRRLFGDIQNDIEMRRRVEKILVMRLTLWEFAASHTVDELMQKALDEIEEIIGSPIGFYHFVEDQRTLSLHAWSTRTLRDFCTAKGSGTHYDIDKAGVWADAVRLKRPVIHNDYASLPDRKGMPEGHATLVRELVVPTLREGRVVSVLGVGNKQTDYDRKDVELLSSIADIVWTIVERKWTEEKIHDLQDKLRDMAIHDPLTGLYNRHYLEETLKRELSRAKREGYSVGFIMIDIDHFKRVNDTYGHKAGDEVLQGLAVHLLANSRASDIIYRYGGEEFLAVLPRVNAEHALRIAEKWRRNFGKTFMESEGVGIRVSISCGISAFPRDGSEGEELIENADRALYQAKGLGRDKSVVWKKV